MMYGMPEGFAALIAKKYAIMQQQADAGTLVARSGANLDNTKAGLMPRESAAGIGLTNAQAQLAAANARNTDETTKFVAPLARGQIGLWNSMGRQNLAQANSLDADTTGQAQLNKLMRPGFGMDALDRILANRGTSSLGL